MFFPPERTEVINRAEMYSLPVSSFLFSWTLIIDPDTWLRRALTQDREITRGNGTPPPPIAAALHMQLAKKKTTTFM